MTDSDTTEMRAAPDDKLRTPAPGRPACEAKERHDEDDWTFHLMRGHGFTREQGWSHPTLAAEAGRIGTGCTEHGFKDCAKCGGKGYL